MTDLSHRNPAPASGGDRPLPLAVPAPAGDPPGSANGRDANGFDPNDFEWRPVPRRARIDGWTPEVQQRFIEALARTGIVEHACEEVGMSVRSAYNLRNAAGSEGFARAWSAVLTRAADRMLDIAFEQAILGEEQPIYDQDGVRTGSKRRYNTRMAMFLLRAYHPDRFGALEGSGARKAAAAEPASVAGTQVVEPQLAAAQFAEPQLAGPQVAKVVASLAPVTPAAPHLLSTPDRLDDMLYVARATALIDGDAPEDATEPYRLPDREAQPERVFDRARLNRRRRTRAHDREVDRQQAEDDDAGLYFP